MRTPPPTATEPAATPAMEAAPPTNLVAVCVATYRRNHLLDPLLAELQRIEIPAGWRMEIRVVDNDAGGMARDIVEKHAQMTTETCRPIRYEIEPARSISRARNCGLDMGPADRIAFIDDDELPEEGWLIELMNVMDESECAAAFGVVHARYEDDTPGWIRRMQLLHKGIPAGRIDWPSTRTSNTLVDGSWIYARGFRFDDRFGRTGGEDTDLFHRMSLEGAVLYGVPRSVVSEDVRPAQNHIGWFLRRRWRGGINFERLISDDDRFTHPLIRAAKRMAVGLGQLLAGVIPAILGRPDRAFRGLMTLALAGGGMAHWLRPNLLENNAGYESEGCAPESSKQQGPQHQTGDGS